MRALPGFKAPKTFLSACVMLVSLTATAGVWDEGDIEAGQALFNANCASCHKVTNEVLAAPGLAGIADRWGASEELLVGASRIHKVRRSPVTATSNPWLTGMSRPTAG